MVAIGEYIDHAIQIVENTPAVLRSLPQWVCWRHEAVNGRQTKIPYDPKQPMAKAKSNDPATWGTFEQAIERYRKDGRFSGVGFTFSRDDPFAGIDLDDCIDPLTGEFTWGRDIVEQFGSYTEISPSGRGVKIFVRGRKPAHARSVVRGLGPDGAGEMEVYDVHRYFAVTGRVLPDTPKAIKDCQAELTALCDRHWPPPALNASDVVVAATPPAPIDKPVEVQTPNTADNRLFRCLATMLAMDVQDHNDGSFRLFAAACRCVEHNLSDHEACVCLRAYALQRPFPSGFTDQELLKRVRDAERTTQRGRAIKDDVDIGQVVRGLLTGTDDDAPQYLTIGQMLHRYPALRPPIIHGLLREGETMNVIAAPKTGKSWLVTDLAMAVATGRKWLDIYETESGRVLILDNELHGETSADRVPRVASARGVDLSQLADMLCVENLRGRLKDIFNLRPYFAHLEPGKFKIIVMDALYRFIPPDTDENDNGKMAQVYNAIDSYARDLGAAFILIHHSTKGSQSGKSITDVGAGAGAQSRACDTHLILREHDEKNTVVLDAAVRSWPPIEPICLQWSYPLWNHASDLDPTDLAKPSRNRKKRVDADAPRIQWTPERFVNQFIGREPKLRDQVLLEAKAIGMSEAEARRMLGAAEGTGMVHRWTFGANQKVQFATVAQPAAGDKSDDAAADTLVAD